MKKDYDHWEYPLGYLADKPDSVSWGGFTCEHSHLRFGFKGYFSLLPFVEVGRTPATAVPVLNEVK